VPPMRRMRWALGWERGGEGRMTIMFASFACIVGGLAQRPLVW